MNDSSLRTGFEIEVVTLLNDLSSVQGELLDVLREKRDSMASADARRMNDLVEREENLAERLQTCHQRRCDILHRATSQGLPARTIEELAAVMPSQVRDKLGKTVKLASAKIRLLQNECLTNWVVAQRSLLHLSQLLEIFAAGGRSKPTYGNGDSNQSRGALVDREV